MAYVDACIIPVLASKKSAYLKWAVLAGAVFKENGALRIVDCWGDDVPKGKVTDLWGAVKSEDGEIIVVSWIEWPSKAVRDAGMKACMNDPRMQPNADMPFSGKRMIFGGFEQIHETVA